MAAFKAAYGTEADKLPAVTNGKVYVFNNRLARSNDNSISTDWFESAVSRPDLVSGVDGKTALRKLPSGCMCKRCLRHSSARGSCCVWCRVQLIGRHWCSDITAGCALER